MKFIGIIIAVALIAFGGYYFFTGESGVTDYNNGEEEVEEGEVASIFANAKNVSSVKYKVTMSSPAGVFEFMYYQKGNKMRSEMGSDENDMIVSIIDADNDVYYSIMTSMNTAVRLTGDQIESTTGGSVQNQAVALSAQDLKEVGKETLNGRDTIIVEVEGEGEVTTLWIWEEYGIPVKSSTYIEGWGEHVAELGEIEFIDISDDMFVLPEGVQIMEIDPEMMQINF